MRRRVGGPCQQGECSRCYYNARLMVFFCFSPLPRFCGNAIYKQNVRWYTMAPPPPMKYDWMDGSTMNMMYEKCNIIIIINILWKVFWFRTWVLPEFGCVVRSTVGWNLKLVCCNNNQWNFRFTCTTTATLWWRCRRRPTKTTRTTNDYDAGNGDEGKVLIIFTKWRNIINMITFW